MTALTLPDPTTEIGAAVEVALAACDEADAISLASFRRAIAHRGQARRLVRDRGRHRRRAGHPRAHHGALPRPRPGRRGVRRGAAPSSGRRWIIDPIDGTHNYMRGVPVYATLLALEIEGELAVGAVSAPALHRRWFSWAGRRGLGRGHRARRLGSRLRPRACRSRGWTRLDEASVVYSSYPSIVELGLGTGLRAAAGQGLARPRPG